MSEDLERDSAARISPSIGRKRTRASPKRRRALAPDSEVLRLAALIETSQDAMIGVTLEGIVTSWNGAASRIYGYKPEDMVGAPFDRIVPLDRREERRELIAKLMNGGGFAGLDTIGLGQGGRRIPISLTVSPYRNSKGEIAGWATVAREASANRGLEWMPREPIESARQALIEAETANDAKLEFLSVISHEIRTPLNAITGFVDLLSKSDGLTPQHRRYAELVQKATVLLLTIVNDVLDASKLQSRRLELESCPFSLSSMIDDIVAIVTPDAVIKNLLLKCTIHDSVPDRVMGDPSRLRQILLNLLSNALKFTETGSITVDVSSRSGPFGTDRVYFSVTDTGVGIPLDKQDLLFKPFSQVDSSVSRRFGGTGLGLSICRRLVELMNGEIGIDSDFGRGSTAWFTATLPRVAEAAREPDIDREIGPPIEDAEPAIRILVVDDVDTNLEIAESYLRDCGYQVDCVGGGQEAIDALQSARYDLVLMDNQMPGMDGMTATRRIRALPSPFRDVPIIAMTADVLPRQVRAFLEAGMNDHIGKPIDRAKLHNNILRWLPSAKGEAVRHRMNSQAFDRLKFDEFVVVAGDEKARRVVDKFLNHLGDAFKSTWDESRREAHSLINTAGVLGLDTFVECCRRAVDLGTFVDAAGERTALDDLQSAQAAARQTIAAQIYPRMRFDRSRASA